MAISYLIFLFATDDDIRLRGVPILVYLFVWLSISPGIYVLSWWCRSPTALSGTLEDKHFSAFTKTLKLTYENKGKGGHIFPEKYMDVENLIFYIIDPENYSNEGIFSSFIFYFFTSI